MIKRVILLACLVFFGLCQGLVFAQGAARYNNPGQGLFLCHYDKGTSESVKGTGWIVYWGVLQPRDPRTLANKSDSWNREELDKLINRLKSGKNMYLHMALYNANQSEAIVYPAWLKIKRIVYSRGNYPDIWDSEYRTRVKEFLTLLNSEFEKAGVLDKIEYIEMAVGGNWAAPEWWLNDNDLNVWLGAAGCGAGDYGCFGTKVNEAVSAMIDIHASSFPKSALMMIKGSCKYTECNYSQYDSQLAKYGMRLMIKAAGIGHRTSNCGYHYELASWSGSVTKTGQEPWGPSVNCKGANMGFDPNTDGACKDNYEVTYTNSLWRERNSYYCIYGDDLFCSDAMVKRTNQFVADHLGAQIRLVSFNLGAGSARVGDRVNLTMKWENTGSAPLMAPLKQGQKWEAGSYKLFLEYVKADGSSIEQVLPDDLATNTWKTTKLFFGKDVSVAVEIPLNLGGSSDSSSQAYKVYLGFTDPNGEKKRFALINTESANESAKGRYLIANSFVVTGKGVVAPTLVPTGVRVTPTLVPPVDPPPTRAPTVRPTATATATVTPACSKKGSGDANCDGVVNISDFATWKTEFLAGGGQQTADFNKDGRVTIGDFGAWKVGFLAGR